MNVLVLGAGKMMEAILLGLKEIQSLKSWSIYSPSGTTARNLSEAVGANWVQDLDRVAPDFVFVGCKPQQLKELKKTIGDRFKNATFISVLAAIDEEEQRNILEVSKLIRVMPNLPVRFRSGVTLISSISSEKEVIQKLFSQLGISVIVKEKELEELTLLTGSGPAFFYEFAQKLSENFSSLSGGQREELARSVLMGAGISVKNNSVSLSEQVNAVTSKGGVTLAVLDKWREDNMGGFLKAGIEAGKKRTEELKALLRQS